MNCCEAEIWVFRLLSQVIKYVSVNEQNIIQHKSNDQFRDRRGFIYPPCDTYALRGHWLEDYIHRGPIRGCGSNRAFNGIKFTELKVTTEIRRTRLTCFLRADGELFAGKTAAYFVVGVHADAVHAGRVQLHDVGLVVGG